MEGTEVVDVIHILGNGSTMGDVTLLQGDKYPAKLLLGRCASVSRSGKVVCTPRSSNPLKVIRTTFLSGDDQSNFARRWFSVNDTLLTLRTFKNTLLLSNSVVKGDLSEYQDCPGDIDTDRSGSKMERSTAYDKRSRRIRRDPQFGYQSMMEHPANPPAYEVRRTARPPTTRTANSRTFLRILKMSYEGEDVKAFTVPLLRINAEDAGYDGLERSLGHIPNLWSHKVKSFEWKDRSLVEISAKELGHQWKEDFYMYKCTDPRARLKINAHFDDPTGVRIYGDAFVFMAEPDTFDMEYDSSYTEVDGSEVLRFIPRAAYVDVDGAFAKSVWDRTECWKVVDKLALKEA